MVADHPVFEKPANPDATIWRYLDFTKFVDLLDTKSLFFTRSDRFNDRFEGSYPEFNVKLRPQVYAGPKGIPEEGLRKISEASKLFRRCIAVNCWHVSPHESAAMWRLYLKGNDGIAIQSSYSRLMSSFLACDDTIYAGLVKYIDYETEWMPEGNLFYSFVHKRKSFAHENELRCLICRFPTSKDQKLDLSLEVISDGIGVPVDLERLISSIFIAPDSPSWLTRLVESVTRKYAINTPVIQSVLAKEPVY